MKFDITLRIAHEITDLQRERILASWRLFKLDKLSALAVLPPTVAAAFAALPADAADDAVVIRTAEEHILSRAVNGVVRDGADYDVERANAVFVLPPKAPAEGTQILVVNPPDRKVH